MTREYDKLVRDRIPEVVRENGETPVTRVATDAEYGDRLAAKLVEEATEYDEERAVEELADVLAVLDAISDHRDLPFEEIREVARQKRVERGGFTEGIVLERVEDGE